MTDTTARATQTSTTQPLRKVLGVHESEESGTQLNPHYFWRTRHYTLYLECEHQQVRPRDRHIGEPQPTFPARVRCADCAPVLAKAKSPKPRATPAQEPLAAALLGMLHERGIDPERLGAWQATHGGWIADDAVRADRYRRIALALIDLFRPAANQPAADSLRAGYAAFIDDPTPERRDAQRRAARSFYSKQNRGGDWYANRGIIAAAAITGDGHLAIAKAREAVSYIGDERRALIESIRSTRSLMDAAVARFPVNLERAGVDPTVARAAGQSVADALYDSAVADLNAGPAPDPTHASVLFELLTHFERTDD